MQPERLSARFHVAGKLRWHSCASNDGRTFAHLRCDTVLAEQNILCLRRVQNNQHCHFNVSVIGLACLTAFRDEFGCGGLNDVTPPHFVTTAQGRLRDAVSH